ncbi:hypothetical protein [Pseudomonas sp.]|uniref:hypothetical protein n=1 Tax=Pseudomonas sp. TaxID=306 RepID=UPI0029135FEC|nr:hypothetical protein [Pseudomonas sp.]MDU4254487.1 hypothetical protein [Pseudomonas sp.]
MQLSKPDPEKMAELIKQAGLPVLAVTEETMDEDAGIEITDLISVSVPTFGGYPCVLRHCPGNSFNFYDESADMAHLIATIQTAMQEEKAEAQGI